MNPWSRLFVVIAICWAIVSPLLIAIEANRGPAQALHDCSDSAYQQYGSSGSPRFDMYRYIAEMDACNHAYTRDGVRLPRALRAMFGSGDRILGVAGWGFLLIPLVLLLPKELEEELGATYHSTVESLVKVCDVVTINAPLHPETEHMFNDKLIGMMKRGS